MTPDAAIPLESPDAVPPPFARRWGVWLLVLCVFAVFGRLCTAEFGWWDDNYTLSQNPRLNPPTLESLAFYWTNQQYSIYIPLTQTVWWLTAHVAQLSGPDPFMQIRLNSWVFHTVNVVAHAGAAAMALLLLRRLLKSDAAALVGALLWALHPVQVESVGWTSGLKDVMAGGFALTSLWCYTRFAQDGRRSQWAWALVALQCAMLSKPSAMMVPVLAGVIDWVLVRRPLRAVVPSAGLLMLSAVPLMIVAALSQPAIHEERTELWQRPLVMGDAYAFYLAKLAWPYPQAFDYGRSPSYVLAQASVRWVWAVPVAVVVAAWAARRRAPELFAGALLMFAALLPVSGLKPFDFQQYSTVGDHYLYVALIGPALVAGWLVRVAGEAKPVIVAASVVLAALGVRSVVQAGHWTDAAGMLEHVIAVNPRSFGSYNNLGSANWSVGRVPEALAAWEKAIALKPTNLTARRNYVNALPMIGRRAEAERLLVDLVRDIALQPHASTEPAGTYAEFAAKLMMLGDLDAAEAYLLKAQSHTPDLPAAVTGLRDIADTRRRTGAARPSTLPSVP